MPRLLCAVDPEGRSLLTRTYGGVAAPSFPTVALLASIGAGSAHAQSEANDIGQAIEAYRGAMESVDRDTRLEGFRRAKRMFARADGPITMKLTLNPRRVGQQQSGNVVGEIVGRDPSLPPVLVACHIDSWWNGTGAFDDGAVEIED